MLYRRTCNFEQLTPGITSSEPTCSKQHTERNTCWQYFIEWTNMVSFYKLLVKPAISPFIFWKITTQQPTLLFKKKRGGGFPIFSREQSELWLYWDLELSKKHKCKNDKQYTQCSYSTWFLLSISHSNKFTFSEWWWNTRPESISVFN